MMLVNMNDKTSRGTGATARSLAFCFLSACFSQHETSTHLQFLLAPLPELMTIAMIDLPPLDCGAEGRKEHHSAERKGKGRKEGCEKSPQGQRDVHSFCFGAGRLVGARNHGGPV